MDTHKVTQLEITGIPLKSAMSDATREWRSGIEDLGVRRPEDSALEMYVGTWGSSTGDADWALRPLFASASFTASL